MVAALAGEPSAVGALAADPITLGALAADAELGTSVLTSSKANCSAISASICVSVLLVSLLPKATLKSVPPKGIP